MHPTSEIVRAITALVDRLKNGRATVFDVIRTTQAKTYEPDEEHEPFDLDDTVTAALEELSNVASGMICKRGMTIKRLNEFQDALTLIDWYMARNMITPDFFDSMTSELLN